MAHVPYASLNPGVSWQVEDVVWPVHLASHARTVALLATVMSLGLLTVAVKVLETPWVHLARSTIKLAALARVDEDSLPPARKATVFTGTLTVQFLTAFRMIVGSFEPPLGTPSDSR